MTTADIAATNAATSASTTAAGATTLTKLAGNFNDFLTLLTAQLKNQDPTSPLDTNQFTSQLVQFTSVAEQITTNKTLGQLLTSSVAQQLGQATNLVGHQVKFTGGDLPLQNGTAKVDFQTTGAQQVQIAVTDSRGNAVRTSSVAATSGANTWTWDGATDGGGAAPDGAYTVGVTASGTALPFQAVGTVTGAQQINQAVQLLFGTTTIGFDKIASFGA